MLKIRHGTHNGKRWLEGDVPLKWKAVVSIDTRTGKGIDEVLKSMADVIRWQARKVHLPSFGSDDIIQELNMIAIMAIPDYDISKGANLCTFLQNHIQKRILNLYKFVTQKRRTAIHGSQGLCKIKCPGCNNFTVAIPGCAEHRCKNCGKQRASGAKWREYPLQLAPLSASERFISRDSESLSIQDTATYEDFDKLGGFNQELNQESIMTKIAIGQAYDQQDLTGKLIIQHILGGQGISEVSRLTGLTPAIIKRKLEEINQRYSV